MSSTTQPPSPVPPLRDGVDVLTTDLSNLPALIAIPRAARILGLSRASAYRYAAAGELPCKRFGGRVYVITAQIRHLFIDTVTVQEAA